MESSRREFLKKSSLLAIAGVGAQLLPSSVLKAANSSSGEDETSTVFKLDPLPYAYDALEPHIDKRTMEVHYTKHHQGYVNNLNEALKEKGIKSTLEDLLKNVGTYNDKIRNNAGGHWNHDFFWKSISPKSGGTPTGKLNNKINDSFGSFENFKAKFEETAMKRFGSGWTWVVVVPDGKLVIGSTPNQDNPLMKIEGNLGGTPLLGLDVWEHAYYLKYENRRAEYIKAWWNVVNWSAVGERLI